jgi:hypothetical protein
VHCHRNAEFGLALVGQPALPGRAAAEALAETADALQGGVDPHEGARDRVGGGKGTQSS